MYPDDDFQQHENPYSTGTESVMPVDNLFFSAWTRPRQTIRQVVNSNATQFNLVFVLLAGVSNGLGTATGKDYPPNLTPETLLMIGLIFGVVASLLGWWIGSALVKWTGSWMGGEATGREMRAAIAWYQLPLALTVVFYIPLFALFGNDMFMNLQKSPILLGNPAMGVVLLVIGLGQIVLAIWSVFMGCHMVAEVQGFRSAWAGFGNLLLASLIIFVAAFLIGFVVFIVLVGAAG